MSDNEKNYDEFIVKLGKTDKHGVDVSDDEPGVGGRHRDDGTFSAMYYDPQPYDNREKLIKDIELAQMNYETAEKEYATAQANTVSEGLTLLNSIITLLAENPQIIDGMKNLTKKTVNGIKRVGTKALSKLRKNSVQTVPNSIDAATNLERSPIIAYSKIEEMSEEEARKLLYETLQLYVQYRRNIVRLSRVVISGTQIQLDGNEIMQLMNECISIHPELLDFQTKGYMLDQTKSIINTEERQQIETELLSLYGND